MDEVYLGHLARVFPGAGAERLDAILTGYWEVHQRALVNLFLADRLDEGNVDRRFEWSGLDELDSALSEGRGVLLVTPHFGDERTLHIGLAIRGYPMHVISSRYPGAPPNVRRARLAVSMRWHHVAFPDESPRWMFEALRAGEVIQTSPTAWGGPKGHWVESFGVPVLGSSTPVRLSTSTGAAVVMALNEAEPGFRFRARLRRLDPAGAGREATQAVFSEFERAGREHPTQYNWMNLVIRHRETNTMARLGRIPREESELERLAAREDWDPCRIQRLEEVSPLGPSRR